MTLPDFLTRDRYGEIRLKGTASAFFNRVFPQSRGSGRGHGEPVSEPASRTVIDVIAFFEANKDEVHAQVAACHAEITRQRTSTPERLSLSELRKSQGNCVGIGAMISPWIPAR